MERRQFLVVAGRLVVLTPVASQLIGCGGTSEVNTDPQRIGDLIRYTSSNDDDHTHTFEITIADIEAPQVDGVSGESSESATGHSHMVTVTAEQLTAIDGGSEIIVTTSEENDHTHTFALIKV